MKQLLLTVILVSAAVMGASQPALADDNDAAARTSRWQALQQALFPSRSLKDGAGIVMLDAPPEHWMPHWCRSASTSRA